MRLPVLALALSTLCLSACADPGRVIALTPDPARLQACPADYPAAPVLAPLAPIVLPDGDVVVPFAVVTEREAVTVRYILAGRAAWHACRSAVAFVEDWSTRVEAGE